MANTSEPLRRAAKDAFDSWIAAARAHLVAGGLPDELAAELALLFVAAVEGGFVLSRTQRSTAALTAAGRRLSDLVQHALDARPIRPRRPSSR